MAATSEPLTYLDVFHLDPERQANEAINRQEVVLLRGHHLSDIHLDIPVNKEDIRLINHDEDKDQVVFNGVINI